LQAARTAEIEARAIANIVYGAARSGIGMFLGVFFVVLARTAECCMDKFDEQILANTAWSLTAVD